MERQKGEYLDMDEDKRRELDQQAAEYQADEPELPSMNADPAAQATDSGSPAAPDATDRVES
jgi:hypothetical protein